MRDIRSQGPDYFFFIFAACSDIDYLPKTNAENEPVYAKPMALFFASDSSLPEEVNYEQVFRLTIRDSSQNWLSGYFVQDT